MLVWVSAASESTSSRSVVQRHSGVRLKAQLLWVLGLC